MVERSIGAGLVWLAMVAGGCGGTPGAHPDDMSAAHHEAEASGHEAEATQHAAMYNPGATAERDRCTGASAPTLDVGPCWTSTVNPTAEHLREAERHRRMAADHRAASQSLRDAEARSCAGLRQGDRDQSPFAHREDIASVTRLTEPVTTGRLTSQHTAGAVVTFRALPGMTVEWLQRLVDCHIARAAALGHDVPEMTYCPLMPRGVSAHVTAANAGFAVAIRGEDEDTVREILRRTQQLAPSVVPAH